MDMRYFVKSKFLWSLIHKKNFSLDMTSSLQVRILILSKEIGYFLWIWMKTEKSCE